MIVFVFYICEMEVSERKYGIINYNEQFQMENLVKSV